MFSQEYIRFVFPGSPYFSLNGDLRTNARYVSFDEEKRSCVFMNMNHVRYQVGTP